MRDRYERLYLLPGLLYCNGSPLLIEAGALLKDNQNNNAVAQLKFRNISDSVIKAVSVMIFALDTAQRPLGDPVIFQYLDLSAKRDENFGQDVPVILPDPGTRAFYVSVREIIFENNEVWNGSENVWQPLPAAVTLNDFFKDSEMTKQFKMRYGSDSNICPIQIGDLWYCACGKINNVNELSCHSCGKNANELLHVNLSALASEKEERLQKEAWEKQLAEQKAAAEKAQREAKDKAEMERVTREREKAEKSTKTRRIINVSLIIFILVGFLVYMYILRPANNYKQAEKLLSKGEYDAAIATYQKLGDYKDSIEKKGQAYYQKGQSLLEIQDLDGAIESFCYAGNYSNANEKYKSLLQELPFIEVSGGSYTLGLKSNGMVIATGKNKDGECNICGWHNIIAVEAGISHSVGLKSDGTVVATGKNDKGQCNVGEWKNIISVAAGGNHTVGLKSNGTVVAVGENDKGQCNVGEWKNIVAIAAGYDFTVGLKSNGTVVAVGDNDENECNVSNWKNVVAIAAGINQTIGVKSNGTVFANIADPLLYFKEFPVVEWQNVTSAATGGSWEILGLKSNGTVILYQSINEDKLDVSGWNNITSISAGPNHVLGLKSDGTIVCASSDNYGECDITKFNSNSSIRNRNLE